MDDPLSDVIDPQLRAWDRNYQARNNLDLIDGSGGEENPAGVWQETQSQADPYTMPQPDSEPLEHYTNLLTGQFSNDWPSSDVDTPMYTGEQSQTSPPPSVNSPGVQKDNLLEDSTFQAFLETARGTPSPGVKKSPQPSNAKGDGPLTLDHPVIGGYLELAPHLQHIIKHIINAQWYKKRRHEPPGEELPVELGLQTRQSSSTPISLFGEFFSANQPYDCLLCPKEARTQKRSLERALGHSRDHFNFKPIEANRKMYTNLNTKNDQEHRAKMYTNLNTKNDQERRALNPAKFCIPCGYKKVTVQNCQRHVKSKAHKNLAASHLGDIWSNTQ